MTYGWKGKDSKLLIKHRQKVRKAKKKSFRIHSKIKKHYEELK